MPVSEAFGAAQTPSLLTQTDQPLQVLEANPTPFVTILEWDGIAMCRLWSQTAPASHPGLGDSKCACHKPIN